MRAVLELLKSVEDTSSQAAETGSVVHAAIAEFHRKGGSAEAGLAALSAALKRFPLADQRDAELYFRPYTLDPRNQGTQAPTHVELPVSLTIDGIDPPIIIKGTLDQIRDGRVWDVKTGVSVQAWPMLHTYAIQLSAYVLAASQTLGCTINPGGLIVMQEYRKRGATPETAHAHYRAPWTYEDCWMLIDRVRTVVARVRAGEVDYGPDVHCTYCPAGGLQNCLPMGREILGF